MRSNGAEAVKVHDLKTLPQYFQAIVDGTKTFEVRRNDRGFEVGDYLFLREWSQETGYTGRIARVTVSYLYAGEWCAPGFCVMAIVMHPSEHARLLLQVVTP